MNDKTPHCCHLECGKDAEFIVSVPDRPYEDTHACADHVGHLLTDAFEHLIYPIGAVYCPATRHQLVDAPICLELTGGTN